MSNKTKILFLGNSSFLQRRILPAVKKIEKLEILICSKSSKINKEKKVYYNNYYKALSSKPDIVYVSLTNNLHFKMAKSALKKNCNVIVDKPITQNLIEAKKLIKIAKKKKLLLAEATVFNYHKAFKEVIKIIGNSRNIIHIQSNFNIPIIKNISQVRQTNGDNLMDMSPYAAAIIRLFFKKKFKISIRKTFYNNTKLVKNFYIFCDSQKLTYFGNFGNEREYLSEVKFFSKKKIISINHQAFALPANKKILLTVKENNKLIKINTLKDDAIKNFMNDVLKSIRNKKYENYYNNIFFDASIRDQLRKQ
tara:strand:+ start:69 stop:992 length:924 start_codon:yes stop_codon:yes gene_type:complete